MKITVSETTQKEIDVSAGDCFKAGSSHYRLISQNEVQVVHPHAKDVYKSVSIPSNVEPCSYEEHAAALREVLEYHAKQLEK